MDFDIQEALGILQDKLSDWLDSSVAMLPNLVLAILVLILFFFLSRGARSITRKILRRFLDQEAIIGLLSTIFSVLTLVAGLLVALNLLHLSQAVSSLLAGAGIVGLALGFAFQDISANFISGIIMAFRRPIQVGDIIDTNSHMGFVKEISLRSTVLETFQGLHVIIPNRMIFQNPLTNYTKTYKRRIDLEVGVSYGDDLEKVKKITEEAVMSNQYLTEEKDVNLVYTSFGASSINFKIMFWVEYSPQNPSFYHAQSEAIMAIKSAFDKNDITIPFPIRTMDFGIKGGEPLKEHIELKAS